MISCRIWVLTWWLTGMAGRNEKGPTHWRDSSGPGEISVGISTLRRCLIKQLDFKEKDKTLEASRQKHQITKAEELVWHQTFQSLHTKKTKINFIKKKRKNPICHSNIKPKKKSFQHIITQGICIHQSFLRIH